MLTFGCYCYINIHIYMVTFSNELSKKKTIISVLFVTQFGANLSLLFRPSK